MTTPLRDERLDSIIRLMEYDLMQGWSFHFVYGAPASAEDECYIEKGGVKHKLFLTKPIAKQLTVICSIKELKDMGYTVTKVSKHE